MADKELKIIKKKYGEKFMHFCRKNFSTILNVDGLLLEVLNDNFANNGRALYDDITKNSLQEQFKGFIYSKVDLHKGKKTVEVKKTPYQLMEEAGYDLYECRTNDDIQKFKKYYSKDEEICTFRDEKRLEICEVFFAVKKDVDKIKRAENPERDDEYGTSVISIQFPKRGICEPSIKNRYNHTVKNPDSTLDNDLDKINLGLEESFRQLLIEKGIYLFQNPYKGEEFKIPHYMMANDGKYYKYNMEINGVYYCPDNIIIKDGEPQVIGEPEKNILTDYFVVDLENKTIKLYDNKIEDDVLNDFNNIKEIKVTTRAENEEKIKTLTIYTEEQEDPIIIELNKYNQIIKYENKNLNEVKDNFFTYNDTIREINIPNVEKIGNNFLNKNKNLKTFEALKLKEVGDGFLFSNVVLSELNIPNVERTGNDFLTYNNGLEVLELGKLLETGDEFMSSNQILKRFEAPKLKKAGDNFLRVNTELETLELPEMVKVRNNCLSSNTKLKEFKAEKLEEVGNQFFVSNENLRTLELPNLKKTGDFFLRSNKVLQQFTALKLEDVGEEFLMSNNALENLELSSLRSTGKNFLALNETLKSFDAPNLELTSELKKRGFLKTKFSKNPEDVDIENISSNEINQEEKEDTDLEKVGAIQKFKNTIKSGFKKITTKIISIFDKKSNLTTTEVNNAGHELENLSRNQNKEDKERK